METDTRCKVGKVRRWGKVPPFVMIQGCIFELEAFRHIGPSGVT